MGYVLRSKRPHGALVETTKPQEDQEEAEEVAVVVDLVPVIEVSFSKIGHWEEMWMLVSGLDVLYHRLLIYGRVQRQGRNTRKSRQYLSEVRSTMLR